jgi:hypothetical protein
VDVREGPATDTLALPGPFDLVFLDADARATARTSSSPFPGSRRAAPSSPDSVVSPRAELEDFLTRMKTHPDLLGVTVPVGKGRKVAFKLR